MKIFNKYILIILFTLLNLLFISNIFAINNNIDFNKYYLQGFFTKICFTELGEDYCDVQHFYTYDNKIYLISDFETTTFKKISNGTYTLETHNKSKINIVVNNNIITNFKLLSNKKDFIQKEEKIKDDDYCRIGLEYLTYKKGIQDKINKHNKIYLVGTFYNNIQNNQHHNFLFLHKENNKIFASSADYEYELPFPTGTFYIKLLDSNDELTHIPPFQIALNKAIYIVDKKEEADLIINNCIVEYYNKNMLPLEFE